MVKGERAAVDAKVNATRVVQCNVAVASCGPYLHYCTPIMCWQILTEAVAVITDCRT